MLLKGSPAKLEEWLRRMLVLVAVFTIPAIVAGRLTTGSDPDLWWHLRAGQWIVQHHLVPATDLFSAYGIGKPWVAYSWLFEAVVYAIYRSAGLLGLLIFKVAMIMAITV